MKAKFNLGDEVWRVQGCPGSERGLFAFGPARVTGIVQRERGVTYLLAWFREGQPDIEFTDEQFSDCLYRSEKDAQRAADLQHNANLERQKRRVAC